MVSKGTFAGLALCCVTLFSAMPALGQQEERPTIESEGKASVEASPDYVRFELIREETGPNTAGIAKRAIEFEERLRVGLDDMGLSPTAVNTLEFHYAGVGKISIKLGCQFRIGAGDDIAERTVRIGEIIDKLSTIGESLKCTLSDPYFVVEDREVVEQDAVARATENALYRADAIASLVGSNIYSVKNVRIVSVVWGRDSTEDVSKPTTNALGVQCSARVRVTYFYGTPR